MKDTEYVYAVGRIRVNELSLLSSADLKRMIAAKSYKEAAAILSGKGYDIEGEDYSAAIEKQKEHTWRLINEVLPDISQMDSLIIKNDFQNMKTAVKAAVTGTDVRHCLVSPSVFDPESIYDLIGERKFSALPEIMRSVCEKCYDILVRTGSAQFSDAVADKGAMKAMLSLAEKADSEIFREIANCTVACADIKILYRCIQAGKHRDFMRCAVASCKAFQSAAIVEKALGGEDEFLSYLEHTDYAEAAELLRISSTAFEKYCDDRLMKIIEKGKMTAFGIDPIAAYYVAKESELLCVRIILSGKVNGIDDEIISERVRALYV